MLWTRSSVGRWLQVHLLRSPTGSPTHEPASISPALAKVHAMHTSSGVDSHWCLFIGFSMGSLDALSGPSSSWPLLSGLWLGTATLHHSFPSSSGCFLETNPVFPLPSSLSMPGCLAGARPRCPSQWAVAQSPWQHLLIPGHGRPCTVQHGGARSALQLGVETEEVGRSIGCDRWCVPGRCSRAKSVAEGTVEGCRGQVHQPSGHG